ncbi:hypothetical protein AX15_000323 [Amanita polypyramis BW_CC]|nr:hypothetical protein AX15_000323 [Amanita polypyramis BW_CC]
MLSSVRLTAVRAAPRSVRVLSTASSAKNNVVLQEALDTTFGLQHAKQTSPSEPSAPEIPPAEDPLLHYLTSNIMRHGRRANASRITSRMLLHIHTLTRAPPLPIFRKAIELASPAVRIVNNRTGSKTIPTPLPLSEKQRTRYAVQWILQASHGKPGYTLEERLACEVIAVVRGQSAALEDKLRVHKSAMINRGNIKATHSLRARFNKSSIVMSPAVSSGKRKESGAARVLGSGTSGVAELLVFHPVDTVAKRLMSNKAKVSFATLSPIIFRDASTAPLGTKLLSLFPGLGYAAGYKIAQRVYKFGGQPWFNDVINRHWKTNFTNVFGERKGKLMIQATAGSLTGIGEVVLLPLDVLKIKRQVNPDAFRGRGVVRIFMEERSALYRGWGWTMARNAPGSFALFGASAATKEYVLGVTDYSKATWTQNFVASIAGAVSSITIAAPLDTVKTRIQNANFEHKVPGITVVKDLIKHEGPGAFFKGLTPKILVVGPKLIFSYTLAQSLIPIFAQYV